MKREDIKNNDIRNLNYFIEKAGYFPRNITKEDIELEYGFFLAFDQSFLLHKASEIEVQSLLKTSREIDNYINQTLDILEANNSFWEDYDRIEKLKKIEFDNDHEIRYEIETALGKPPKACYPIYMMTVESNDCEELVYMGKTNSENARFKNGHSAITKLHDPKFNGMKRIYLGTVMFISKDNKDYIPLEMMASEQEMSELLAAIEGTLINSFKPELNTQNKKKTDYSIGSQLHIQNFVGSMLHDEFVYLD